MTKNKLFRAALGAGSIFAVVALSGCSFEFKAGGNPSAIDRTELEQTASSALGKEVGFEPESIECPDPLEPKKGEETRCTLTDQGVSYGLTATVVDVVDGKAQLGFQVDEKPLS